MKIIQSQNQHSNSRKTLYLKKCKLARLDSVKLAFIHCNLKKS